MSTPRAAASPIRCLPGSYRLINYTGTLSGSTTIGSIPSGFAASQIQTVIPSQVNLIAVQNGVPMQFWDGADTTGNGTLNGGTGTWNNGAGNWTDTTGSINQSWIPGVGIFTGAAGVVTIAQPVSAMGLQFITDGYQVTSAGSALTMIARPDGSMPFIRVDPGATVDIGAEIAGTAGLLKADAGTLILSGTNTYTGGTVIGGGTLQLGNGGTAGSIVGDVTDDGALVFDRSDVQSFAGVISGSGTVTQAGTGTTILTGTNTLHGRHADQRRHAAAGQWRRQRQHRRQHRRQWRAGLRPQRCTEHRRGHQRVGNGDAGRHRNDDPDWRQHLYGSDDRSGGDIGRQRLDHVAYKHQRARHSRRKWHHLRRRCQCRHGGAGKFHRHADRCRQLCREQWPAGARDGARRRPRRRRMCW